MAVHLIREVENLKKSIIKVGSLVESNLRKAIISLQDRDSLLAEEVRKIDHVIDKKEIEVEEECLKTLALYQPVAHDLRFIVAILKINNDLERVGDLAVNIAKSAIYINEKTALTTDIHFEEISQKALSMLTQSINSFVNLDSDLARRICDDDDILDEMVYNTHGRIKKQMEDDPTKIGVLLRYLYICRHFERIGDLATNIAEDTIYLKEGIIVRHGGLDS